MISSEVQRTLVKSPPELWAELSDPAALARHLGELGEIRIVRTEPERVVEWTAEHTTGVVSIKPSGWGTRVTLTATREPTGTAPASRAEVEIEVQAEVETEAEASEGRVEPAAESEVVAAEPETPSAPMPEHEPEPRRGFFARLFRRRRETAPPLEAEPSAERPDAFAAVRQVLAPESFAAAHPFAAEAAASSPETPIDQATAGDTVETGGEPDPAPSPPKVGEPSTDISAELMAAEDVTADEVSAAEVTAVLTAVLDRLGAAHHRPFSRG